MHVSETAVSSFKIDVNNIKYFGGEIYTYMAVINKEKNQYTGPLEFIINCQQKSYKFGSTTTPNWSITTAGGIAASKLCGDFHQNSGDRYEYLFSLFLNNTKVWQDTYWVPKDVVRDPKNPEILIVKFYSSYAPPPMDFNNSSGGLAEVDCQHLKYRFAYGKVGSISIDASKDWAAVSPGSPINTRICLNKELAVKQYTESNSIQPESIESSKSTCIDLGFKTGTEAFGGCVLELSSRKNSSQGKIATQFNSGDGTADHNTCSKYGFSVNTTEYAQCRMQIDLAKSQAQEQQRQYERQIADQQRAKDRAKGEAALMMGLGMLANGGQRQPINSNQTILEPPPQMNRIYNLPGGKSMTCSTFGMVTNCN